MRMVDWLRRIRELYCAARGLEYVFPRLSLSAIRMRRVFIIRNSFLIVIENSCFRRDGVLMTAGSVVDRRQLIRLPEPFVIRIPAR
jgi:hypothetical protein